MPQFPINSLANLGLPSTVTEQFLDPQVKGSVELFISSLSNLLQFIEQYSGITRKDITLWDYLVASDTLLAHQLRRFYVVAGENLTFGQLVEVYNVAGVAKVRRAQATAGTVRPARGFVNISTGITSGSRGEVILSEGILTVSGVTPGQALYLSAATPGAFTATAPTGVGQLEQFVGFGVATDRAYVNIANGNYIQH